MKRVVVTAFTLVLLVFIVSVDSSVMGQRRGSSRRGESRGSAPTLTKEQILTTEAQALAKDFWDSILSKCGDTYYWMSGGYYTEAKGEPIIRFENPHYYPPKQLSTAEQLNNVDPQPIEFSMDSIALFPAMRQYRGLSCNLRVCPWKDNAKIYIVLRKSKGQWTLKHAVTNLNALEINKPVPCASDGTPIWNKEKPTTKKSSPVCLLTGDC